MTLQAYEDPSYREVSPLPAGHALIEHGWRCCICRQRFAEGDEVSYPPDGFIAHTACYLSVT
jgi:hypothetical protein